MFARIFENMVATFLALLIVGVFLAYFGATPIDRALCDAKTDNPASQTSCIIQTALN